MKKLTFTVSLTFSGELNTAEDVQHVAQTIAESLKYMADTGGIAPEDSGEYTEEICVESKFLKEPIVEKLGTGL